MTAMNIIDCLEDYNDYHTIYDLMDSHARWNIYCVAGLWRNYYVFDCFKKKLLPCDFWEGP